MSTVLGRQAASPPDARRARTAPPRRMSVSPTGVQAIAITVVAAALFAVFSAFASHFFSLSNVYSMAQISAYTFIPAVGLTFLFIAAEIDLSVGAVVAFAGVVMGLCVANYGIDPWLAALITVLLGAGIGAINGFVTTVIGVQSFIVTLGMLSILGGGSLVLTGGLPVNYPQNLDSSLFVVTNGTVGGFPAPVFWAIGAFVVGLVLLRLTKFGFHVYAVGGDRNAAREMGVKVRLTKFSCFVLTGALAGVTAVLQSDWLKEADGGDGAEFTLQVIAAIIVGGVALYGGAGSVYGSMIGTIITGMLGSGLILLGLNSNWPELIEGAIIIVVVTIGLGLNHLRGGRGPSLPGLGRIQRRRQ